MLSQLALIIDFGVDICFFIQYTGYGMYFVIKLNTEMEPDMESMEKFLSIIPLLGLSLLMPNHAIAGGNTQQVGFTCPDASGSGAHSLSNYGGFIAGYGKESINSVPCPDEPYFTFHYSDGHYPANLPVGTYVNSGVDYNPVNGTIICNYSSGTGYDPLHVSYHLSNGFGGLLVSSALDQIVILQYLGLA